MNRIVLILALLSLSCQVAWADPTPPDENYEEPEKTPWKEETYQPPSFPKDDDLIEFYVSPAISAKFYIDQTSLSVGRKDKVVRYVMVVKTSGGATNISAEGIRCDTYEWRLYATGTAEGTWAKSRQTEWRKFKAYNKQQVSLATYYFCPNGFPIQSAAEGIDALKLGAHPLVTQRYQQ